MDIESFSPSSSVVRHFSVQSHHLHVSVNSIHPPCPRSSSFSGMFHIYYMPAGTISYPIVNLSRNPAIANMSLQTGQVLNDWREANFAPTFKMGDKHMIRLRFRLLMRVSLNDLVMRTKWQRVRVIVWSCISKQTYTSITKNHRASSGKAIKHCTANSNLQMNPTNTYWLANLASRSPTLRWLLTKALCACVDSVTLHQWPPPSDPPQRNSPTPIKDAQ